MSQRSEVQPRSSHSGAQAKEHQRLGHMLNSSAELVQFTQTFRLILQTKSRNVASIFDPSRLRILEI